MFTQYMHNVAKISLSKGRNPDPTSKEVRYAYRELRVTNRDGETATIGFLSDDPACLEIKEEGKVA